MDSRDRDIDQEVFELLDKARPIRKRKRPHPAIILLATIGAMVAATAALIYFFPGNNQHGSRYGEITSPAHGDSALRVITVSGVTRNLPPERAHVILAVDVPGLGLTWPKLPFVAPNTAFQVSVYEGGPAGTCVLSLYAVNTDLAEKIKEWHRQERFGGMPMFPERYRIDSITLNIMG